MNRLFIHNALFRILSAPIFGILVYLLILLIHNTVEDIDKIYNHQELYVCIALCYISLESMRLTLKLMDRFANEDNFQRRLFSRVVGTLIVSLTLVAAAISAYFRVFEGFSIGSDELNIFLLVFGFSAVFYNILYFSHYYLQRENKKFLEQEKKLREKVEADFSSFKNEINPELLYESLENLILTLHNSADAAEEQIDSLAGIYRYSLVNRHRELITLEDELDASANLLHLLNFKYRNSVTILSTVADPAAIHLVPGSLLVTIDSITRNTLISEKSPLNIRIYIDDDDDYLVLEHKLNNRLTTHEGSMNAFAQLQRSYLFFSDKPFVQVKAGNDNFIKFPLVRIAQTMTEPS